MISEDCLIGRRLMMYATPSVRPKIEKVVDSFYGVCRLYLENGMTIIFSEENVEKLLAGIKVQGWALLGIGEE